MEAALAVPLDVGVDAAHGEVHLAQPPGGVVRLLAIDGDVADAPAVLLHEAFGLHEHAAGAAARVVDAALVRREHLDQQPDDAAGRVELAALLPLGAGKLRKEVLVNPAKDVLGPVLLVPEADVADQEARAKRRGFKKVSQMKLEVAKTIKNFVFGGGFMFAMCSATDSWDIALAAQGTDICDVMYDGDAQDPIAQTKLDYSQCFAFENFHLRTNPFEYEYSDIDANFGRTVQKDLDYFTLFDFSAKWDPVPTMLCQDHTKTVKGFLGQTTAFNKNFIKSSVLVMGQNKSANEARYIHGEYGKGLWTWYGGHDPEDYQHLVGDPPTNLDLHPNSPGYRLILNNVLFPAARKKKQKT